MYQQLGHQEAKLGSWELGQISGDTATGIVNIVGTTITNVTRFITQDKTARAGFRAQRDIANVTQTETTKRLAISGKTATAQQAIDVQRVGAQYGGIAKIILVSGVALTGLLLAGGVMLSMTKRPKGQ